MNVSFILMSGYCSYTHSTLHTHTLYHTSSQAGLQLHTDVKIVSFWSSPELHGFVGNTSQSFCGSTHKWLHILLWGNTASGKKLSRAGLEHGMPSERRPPLPLLSLLIASRSTFRVTYYVHFFFKFKISLEILENSLELLRIV
jgi:hypothetical protein